MASTTQRYALIGATGATGSTILKLLLSRPSSSTHVNVYARSEEKLLKAFPDLRDRKNVSIFIGPMAGQTLQPCLKNCSVIFNAIGTNTPIPGLRIAQETAAAIVSALRALSHTTDKSWRPNVIYLSSASINKVASKDTPWLLRWIVYNGIYHVYEDMRIAISFFKSEGVAKGLMELSCVCPGAIVEGPKGSRGEGVKLDEVSRSPMTTYPEVALAMIEMAENKKWLGKEVLLKSAQPEDIPGLMKLLLTNVFPGLVVTFVPALFPLMRSVGIF